MSILKALLGALFTTLLDWIYKRYQQDRKEKEDKAQDDKAVDQKVEKAKSNDLGTGLNGTDDLQNEFNRNT